MDMSSLFDEVGEVQLQLVLRNITEYDANRIYALLETFSQKEDRVSLVIQQIVATVRKEENLPPDMGNHLNLEEVEQENGDWFGIDDYRTQLNSDRYNTDSNMSNYDELDLNHDESDSITSTPIAPEVPHLVPPQLQTMKAQGNEMLPHATIPENNDGALAQTVNNNDDDNNNTFLPHGSESTDCLWSEARKILSVIPQLSLEKIHDYLIKYKHCRNRIQVVSHVCLNEALNISDDDVQEILVSPPKQQKLNESEYKSPITSSAEKEPIYLKNSSTSVSGQLFESGYRKCGSSILKPSSLFNVEHPSSSSTFVPSSTVTSASASHSDSYALSCTNTPALDVDNNDSVANCATTTGSCVEVGQASTILTAPGIDVGHSNTSCTITCASSVDLELSTVTELPPLVVDSPVPFPQTSKRPFCYGQNKVLEISDHKSTVTPHNLSSPLVSTSSVSTSPLVKGAILTEPNLGLLNEKQVIVPKPTTLDSNLDLPNEKQENLPIPTTSYKSKHSSNALQLNSGEISNGKLKLVPLSNVQNKSVVKTKPSHNISLVVKKKQKQTREDNSLEASLRLPVVSSPCIDNRTIGSNSQLPICIERKTESDFTIVDSSTRTAPMRENDQLQDKVIIGTGTPKLDPAISDPTSTPSTSKCTTVSPQMDVSSVQLPSHHYLQALKDLFPHVDIGFLNKRCYEFGPNEQLDSIVIMLLDTSNLPLKQNVELNDDLIGVPALPQTKEERLEAFQALQDILPDADPEYLRRKFDDFANDQDKIKAFVADSLENKNYPTLTQYLKRQETLKLQKQYTENFSVSSFLETFADPFKYFTKNQLTAPITAGRNFLMARYPRIRCSDIDRIQKKHVYKLLPACKELDSCIGTLRSERKGQESLAMNYICSQENIPLLQEIAFIQHEDEIRQYIEREKKKKMKSFQDAKEKRELLTCGCCYDDELLSEDMVACNDGHLFCKECVRKGAEVQIGNGKSDFPCLEDCGQQISMNTLEAVLKPSVFTRMVQRKQLEEVKLAGIEDLETCPFCDFGTIPSPDDKVFTCLNSDCMKISCRSCKELSHIPLRCDEVEHSAEVKMRTYIEDRMTEALVRTCWKCSKKFIKEDGCNKMTCTCGALMCYLCRQPVKDYSHFNGQGGEDLKKCALYTNNDLLHVNAVSAEAKKAKEEMEAQNPSVTLIHDPTKLLPKAKQPVPAGVQIPGAARMPAGIIWPGMLPVQYGYAPPPFPLPVQFRLAEAEVLAQARLGYEQHRIARPVQIQARQAQVQARQAQVQARQAQVQARQAQMQGRQAQIQGRQAQIQARPVQMQARPVQMQARQAQMQAILAQVRPVAAAGLIPGRPILAAARRVPGAGTGVAVPARPVAPPARPATAHANRQPPAAALGVAPKKGQVPPLRRK